MHELQKIINDLVFLLRLYFNNNHFFQSSL